MMGREPSVLARGLAGPSRFEWGTMMRGSCARLEGSPIKRVERRGHLRGVAAELGDVDLPGDVRALAVALNDEEAPGGRTGSGPVSSLNSRMKPRPARSRT